MLGTSRREANLRRPEWRFKAGQFMVLLLGVAAIAAAVSVADGPPATRRDGVIETIHGVQVADPYRWLEEQWSPETRAWIDAENQYTDSILNHLPGREELRQRLTRLMKVEVIGMPRERTGRYFFSRRRADQDLFVIYMRQGLAGKDEVLVDPHPMSPDHTTSVSLMDVSKDGTLMAYGVRQGGQDEVTVHVLEVDARKDLPERLPKGRYEGLALKPDKKGLYYSRQTPDGPRVFYHTMGSDPTGDHEVFGKGYGPGEIILVDISEDGRYLVLDVFHGSAAEKTEIYYQDLEKPGAIRPIVNDIDARFFGEVGGDQLFMETNWKASNGRILAVDLQNSTRDRWREIIPESDAVIENFSLAGGKLFVNYLHNVSSQLQVFDPGGRRAAEVGLPTLGSISGVSGRWQGNEAFFTFTSFLIPPTIYHYDVTAGRQEVWAQVKVPIDGDKYDVEQTWYESKDKTRVPMFLVHAKGTKRDGSNPTLLTGYGGFNASLTPSFSPDGAAWVESGGVFALPNLRGGGEFGEQWHRAGMLQNKQHVFDDFIAAAQWLIDNHYTQPSKLSVTGQSNGGLLVGAALTQRPELFRAVVCRYPLVDMLRYQKFLVARFWVPEYGSADDPEQFKYLYAYSPYQNVKKGTRYPSVLLVSGDGDTRVDPLHARKMAALLQWATGSEGAILLHYDTKSGHSGGRPLSKQIDESTDELSFLLWQLGVQSR